MALQELVVARQQAVLERKYPARPDHPAQRRSHCLPPARPHRATHRHIAKLEAALTATLAQEDVAAQAARLAQVQGVGLLTATTALALCPELGTLSQPGRPLLGVAPFNHDSGQAQGHKRHIAGGRLRCAIYMAALSAVRSNPILRAFYQQLRRRAAKVALTAVMRKLFLLLPLKNPNFVLAS